MVLKQIEFYWSRRNVLCTGIHMYNIDVFFCIEFCLIEDQNDQYQDTDTHESDLQDTTDYEKKYAIKWQGLKLSETRTFRGASAFHGRSILGGQFTQGNPESTTLVRLVCQIQ